MAAAIGRAASAACLVVLSFAVYALGSQQLTLVRVAGGSMSPTLTHGDVCVVRASNRIAPRDIVLVEPPGHASRVLHRVFWVRGDSIFTKGDANPVADFEPVPCRAVVGRVALTVPVGRFLQSLATRMGW